MARYFLTVSYNGREYNGWQVQDNTPNTVDQVLEEKLSMLLKQKVDLVRQPQKRPLPRRFYLVRLW